MKNQTSYKTMSGEELGVRLRELQGKLLTLRTQIVTEKVEDPTAIGKTRREIARVLTARRALHLGIAQGGGAAGKGEKAPKAAKPARKPKAAKPVAEPAAKAAAKAPQAAGEKKTPARKTTRKTTRKAASK